MPRQSSAIRQGIYSIKKGDVVLHKKYGKGRVKCITPPNLYTVVFVNDDDITDIKEFTFHTADPSSPKPILRIVYEHTNTST